MRLNSIAIVVSFLCLLVSFWNRNELPGNIDYVPALDDDPSQTGTRRAPFTVAYNDVEYRIDPQFEYDLTGLVVSFRHHDHDYSRMHRLANDHLNMMDICVIWGDNTRARLDKLDFWNGIFTCNVSTRDSDAWDSFDMTRLSNNHLLSTDDRIRERVQEIRIGDQIRVRGQLASYRGPTGERGTSTTRTDTGDGACETIYIDRFEIVRKASSRWRQSMYGSLLVFLITLGVHFRRPFRPYRSA